MNPFDIEILRQNLLRSLPSIHGKSKVFVFYNFYQSLLDSNDETLVEAYCLEFIQEYITSLRNYSAFCLAPGKSERLVSQLITISALNSVQTFKHNIITEAQRIRKEIEEILSVLSGSRKNTGNNKLFFPLIEGSGIQTTETHGFLETVRVAINRRKDENKLYVFPSAGTLDERIEKQILDSFSCAMKYLNKYRKKFGEFHEIMVYFDNYSANYIGNSLGIALTVGFIEQLTSLYNLPFLITIQNNVASTGSVNINGKINSVNKEFIEKKVEVVFYSPINGFIIPKGDEIHAFKKLEQLKELYPKRDLTINGVNDLDDIFNRRNLINISRQNIFVRSYKTSRKNWQVSAIIILLYMITAIVLVRDFDENPNVMENKGRTLYIKNKSGRILWTKNVDVDSNLFGSRYDLNYVNKLIDINNDGLNEIILTNESFEPNNGSISNRRIVCYNSRGDLMWTSNLDKAAICSTGNKTPSYIFNLIDTITLNDKKKYLLTFASDVASHNSAIFKIDLLTGKLSGDILWHNGPIRDCCIIDLNNDGKKEIAFAAFNTSFKKIAFGVINSNNLSGQCPFSVPSNSKCIISGELLAYILLPRSSFTGYAIKIGLLNNNSGEKTILLKSAESDNVEATINFRIPLNYKNVSVSLKPNPVSKKLVHPANIKMQLSDQILFWNGKEFINQSYEKYYFK